MELVDPEICKISVSSVLDRNKKEYGKQYLYDAREDTCWNSDQVCKIRQIFHKTTFPREFRST